MKKIKTILVCVILLIVCTLSCAFIAYPTYKEIEFKGASQLEQITELGACIDKIALDISDLQDSITVTHEKVNACKEQLSTYTSRLQELEVLLIDYYIEKLSDSNYISTYDDDATYYIAAEALGQIGRPALPKLIEHLDTAKDQELGLTLYALMLASQADNSRSIIGENYFQPPSILDPIDYDMSKQLALDWWNLYKIKF